MDLHSDGTISQQHHFNLCHGQVTQDLDGFIDIYEFYAYPGSNSMTEIQFPRNYGMTIVGITVTQYGYLMMSHLSVDHGTDI